MKYHVKVTKPNGSTLYVDEYTCSGVDVIPGGLLLYLSEGGEFPLKIINTTDALYVDVEELGEEH